MVYATELKPAWDQKAKSPNEYFENLFPSQTKQYGPAFFEISESSVDGFRRINPVSLNVDFFAATFSDERLGLLVMYYEPEMQFYYLEPIQKIYMPTSPEKLQNLYRGLLIRCAQELNGETNKFPLFHEFRSDKWAKAVTSRAKSILACDQTFFSATSPHQRIQGPELQERLMRVLCETMLEKREGSFLTVSQAYGLFCQLAQQKQLAGIKRSMFRATMQDLVRDMYGMALRRDIPDALGKQQEAWKGLRLVEAEVVA